MPAWVPIVKALMPHVAQIVSAAAPAFTARPGMVAQQINELQAAAQRSDDAIRVLAEQAQQSARALEDLGARLEQGERRMRQMQQQLQRLWWVAAASLGLGALAAILAVVLLVTR